MLPGNKAAFSFISLPFPHQKNCVLTFSIIQKYNLSDLSYILPKNLLYFNDPSRCPSASSFSKPSHLRAEAAARIWNGIC